jgi:putative tryptophan/tyrosine transport system substrate-binding protein
MKRREFLGMLGGATAAWPLVVRAQQALPTVGSLAVSAHQGQEPSIAAFLAGLGKAGYVSGRDVLVEFRDANNQLNCLTWLRTWYPAASL